MKTANAISLIDEAMSFEDYLAYTSFVLSGKHRPAFYKSEKMAAYTLSNFERMKQKQHNTAIHKKLYNQLTELATDWIWIVLAEPWCGDASHTIPVLHSMSQCNEKIAFRILLRDLHPALMDMYLTDESRSIPKLICIEKNSGIEMGTWGPRPQPAQEMVMNYKKEPNMRYGDFVRSLHQWYEHDADHTIQEEFIELTNKWIKK